MSEDIWQVHQLDELLNKVAGSDPRYFEFLRVPTINCGIYRLPAGAKDMQAPHLEDEVYVVLDGRARLRINDQEREVTKGTILYVQATLDHSFFDIQEDLTLLAFFGPSKPIWDSDG